MYEYASKVRMSSSLLVVSLACASAISLAATEAHDVNGQWIGGSLLDGQRETAKTLLDLGAGEESSTLRIEKPFDLHAEARQPCAADADASAWSRHSRPRTAAKPASVSPRAVRGPRRCEPAHLLVFDVVYPGSDGTSNHRHGVLSRYP